MSKTEVRTELKLDDLASAGLAKIQSGFKGVSGQVDSATRGMIDFAKQTAAVAIGVNLGNIFGGAKDALMGTFAAANKSEEQFRELSKTVSGMSTLGGKVEDLSKATSMTTKEAFKLQGAAKGATTDFAQGAHDVYNRLADIARASGVARGELVDAFTQTGANTTKTNDQLVAMISNVAQAARALPAPVKDIVEGFAEIEKNTISASNPLIQMVKQANLFRGHNEQIALKLQSMGRQGMLNVMNKALKEMQERAKTMPMTLKEMGDQLGDMKSDVMKLIGEPMVAALTPAFKRLQEWISSHRAEIEKYAHMMGTKLGGWIKDAAKLIQEGFNYIVTHADEIKKAIKEGFEFAKETFKWMIDHKELVAGAAIGSKAVSSGAAGGAVDAIKGTMNFAKALSAANATGIGPLAVGSAGAAASLAVFAVALAAVGAAVYMFGEYLKETGGYLNPSDGEAKKDMTAQVEATSRIAAGYEQLNEAQIKEFDRFREAALANARVLGENTRVVGEQIDAEWAKHRALQESAKGMVEARNLMQSFEGADIGKMTEDQANEYAAKQREAAKVFADSFNEAAKTSNAAALGAAVDIVTKSKSLQQALLDSGSTVGLSLDKLAEVIGDKAKDFVEDLKKRAGEDRASADNKPPPKVMQFNGGQTFNIKQDFRDQDPDRIAVVFKRDMMRAAESRLQARTALPHGG